MSRKETAELLLHYLKEKKGLKFFKSRWDVQKINRMYGLDLTPSKVGQGIRLLHEKGVIKKISQDRYQIVQDVNKVEL